MSRDLLSSHRVPKVTPGCHQWNGEAEAGRGSRRRKSEVLGDLEGQPRRRWLSRQTGVISSDVTRNSEAPPPQGPLALSPHVPLLPSLSFLCLCHRSLLSLKYPRSATVHLHQRFGHTKNWGKRGRLRTGNYLPLPQGVFTPLKLFYTTNTVRHWRC